jgi:hypothetical protein
MNEISGMMMKKGMYVHAMVMTLSNDDAYLEP